MNCRDITEILDNGKVDELDNAWRQEAEAHLATCADCTSDWNAQGHLAALPDLTVSASFAAACRAAVATVPASNVARPLRNRRRLAGVIAALAAAAAMLAILLRPAPPTLPVRETQTERVEVAPTPMITREPAKQLAEAPREMVVAVSAKPGFTVRVLPVALPANNGNGTAGNDSATGLSSAMAEEANAIANDPARRKTLESVRTALIKELRTVPGLQVVESSPAIVEPSSRHYQVQINLDFLTTPDGKFVRTDSRYVSVSFHTKQVLPDGKFGKPVSQIYSIDLQTTCADVTDASCHDVTGTVITVVRVLRQYTFPPDAAAANTLQARLQDSSQDSDQRLKALLDLIKLQTDPLDKSLLRDPKVIRAAIGLAASADPAQRAQIWRAMQGVGHPDLIQPLMTSLQQDSYEVRLAAVATLAADFSTDPRVKALLESVALADSQPLVRAVAERGLSGEETWTRYVVASLKDSRLPAAQRVEALVYDLYPPGPTGTMNRNDYFGEMDRLLDDGAIRALAEAMPEAGTPQGDKGEWGLLLSNVGYGYNKNPAVTGMLLRILEQDNQSRNRTIAGEVLARAHGTDPQVLAALNKALESDPDVKVRDYIRQIMGEAH